MSLAPFCLAFFLIISFSLFIYFFAGVFESFMYGRPRRKKSLPSLQRTAIYSVEQQRLRVYVSLERRRRGRRGRTADGMAMGMGMGERQFGRQLVIIPHLI